MNTRTHSRRRGRGKRWSPRFAALVLALVCVAAGVAVWLHGALLGLPGEDIETPSYVQKDYLTVNEWSRPGTPLEEIRGVVIHYVGNPDTSAAANRNYFESLKDGAEDIYASAHFIVGLEGEVVQCIPLTEWAYASNSRNGDTVSVEVCHPDETGEFSPVTYDRTVELTAWLCSTFGLTADDVLRHYDVSGKICPKYYVENEDAWSGFLADVDARLAQMRETPPKN